MKGQVSVCSSINNGEEEEEKNIEEKWNQCVIICRVCNFRRLSRKERYKCYTTFGYNILLIIFATFGRYFPTYWWTFT